MKRLFLGYNSFEDTMENAMDVLIEFPDIQLVDFGYNVFNGSFPAEISSLYNLQHIDFTSNGLSGTIPSALSELESLEYLYVSENMLTGILPDELCNISSLKILKIGDMSMCYPLCLKRPIDNSGLNGTRCQDSFDLAFCDVVATTSIDDIIPVATAIEITDYESEHPVTGKTKHTLVIRFTDAIYYYKKHYHI
jgi:hypothetical protein